MSGKITGPALVFLLTLCLVSAATTAGAQDEEQAEETVNPHNFVVEAYCKYCHTERPPELSHDPVTTCTKCHMANVGNHPVANHPVGETAEIHVPASLPLTGDGRMVCYTCHDPHNTSEHPKMLRVSYFKLCVSCHAGY